MSHTAPTGGTVPGSSEPFVRTALVVDDSAAARYRVATLLKLGGWHVHQAVGTEAALRLAALLRPVLVVTDMDMRNGHGATLMRRLREQGSTAHFLVVTRRRTSQVRALAECAGALACLAKPVDPRLFLDVMTGLSPVAVTPAQVRTPDPVVLDEDVRGAGSEMFVSVLPHRLATIASSVRRGDAAGASLSAEVLAAESARLGHAEIAFLARTLAEDARRGIVAHSRLMSLVSCCARLANGPALVA